MTAPAIRDIRYTSASLADRENGLLGWLSCRYHDVLLDGLTLRRTRDGRLGTLPQHGAGAVWSDLAAVRPEWVTRRFKATAKRAGLAELRLHDLRHGFACRLREAGVAIQVIAQLAGHKSLATTLRYSRHMAGTSLRNAIDALERSGSESALQG